MNKGEVMKSEKESKQLMAKVNGYKNITGAEAILRSLIEEGVTTIFGYPDNKLKSGLYASENNFL